MRPAKWLTKMPVFWIQQRCPSFYAVNPVILISTSGHCFHTCAVLWKSTTKWTAEEDRILLDASEQGKTVTYMAALLPERKLYSVYSRLEQLKPETVIRRRRWTPEEDTKLVESLRSGMTWGDVGKIFPDRSPRSAEQRHHVILTGKRTPRAERRSPWTMEEDARLKELRDKHQLTWVDISSHFPNRTYSAITSRYSIITPDDSRIHVWKKHRWTKAEDDKLKMLRDAGKTWFDISRILGRPPQGAIRRFGNALKHGDSNSCARFKRAPGDTLSQRWSPMEQATLQTMMADGMSLSEMAPAFSRSYRGVEDKVRTLRLQNKSLSKVKEGYHGIGEAADDSSSR